MGFLDKEGKRIRYDSVYSNGSPHRAGSDDGVEVAPRIWLVRLPRTHAAVVAVDNPN